MGWLEDFRQDMQRYVNDGMTPVKAILTQQGLWALLEYRLARAARRLPLMGPVFVTWQKVVEATTGISLGHGATIGPGLWIGHFGHIIVHDAAVLGSHCHVCQGVTIGRGICREGYGVPVFVTWQKVVEATTGISLGHGATIGPGLWIGHFGHIIVHDAAVLGSHCHLCQGVTIGRGICREGYGVPVIGDGVYVGPNATVLGSITIGDRARIAANTVVTESVPAGAYVHPAPVAVEPSFVDYCEGTLGVSPSR